MTERESIRYINAYIAVNKELDEKEKEAFSMAISALEKQEKDRWIPVIRCENCKYYGPRRWCELHSSVFDDNAFCSYGERREE